MACIICEQNQERSSTCSTRVSKEDEVTAQLIDVGQRQHTLVSCHNTTTKILQPYQGGGGILSGKNSVPRLKTMVKILSRNLGQNFPKINFPGLNPPPVIALAMECTTQPTSSNQRREYPKRCPDCQVAGGQCRIFLSAALHHPPAVGAPIPG